MCVDDDNLPDGDTLQTFIATCETPPKLREIARKFSIPPHKRPALRALLRKIATDDTPNQAQDEDGQSLPTTALIEIIQMALDGTGLAEMLGRQDSAGVNINIVPTSRNQHSPKSGDRCLARLKRSSAGITGEIMRILPQRQSRFFGRVMRADKGRKWMVEPAEKGGLRPLFITSSPFTLKQDDLIEAELIKEGPHRHIARPLRNLGAITDPKAFTALAIAEFQLPHIFSDEMLAQADTAAIPELGERTDLREIPFITIDGEDAKDFDDAVYALPDGDDGWRLMVAIADVSAYVVANSPLDEEAQKRGNSVYLPGTVIPMLPEALSNGVCSLRPGEDRACLTVEIFIDRHGQKTSHRFIRGLMRSVARLTYTKVQQVIEGTLDEKDCQVPDGVLHNLSTAYHLLHKAREKRGTLNLNIAEKKIILSDEGKAQAVVLHRQQQAHQLIEEFMILANICAAESLELGRHICVYRIHDRPDPEKIEQLRELTHSLDIPFSKGQVITPHRLNDVLTAASGTAAETAIHQAVLRCQARAIYDIDNIGHYGLGLSRYAHFTSPIRRYSDLMVHRGLITVCKLGDERAHSANRDDIASTCKAITQTEQTATKAERRTLARLAASLLSGRLGENLSVNISGVTKAGLFVVIEEGVAEGFVSRRTLPDDFYKIDNGGMSMTGTNTGWRFSVGDKLDCILANIAPASGDIDLHWRSGGTHSPPKHPTRRPSKRRRTGNRR